MNQYFGGFLKFMLVLALAYFLLWSLSVFGVIDSKALLLQVASIFPNLRDLPESYELGKKQSELLARREKELQDLEARLKEDQAKLAKEREDFKNEQNKWQNEHPQGLNKIAQATNGPTIYHPPQPGKFPPPTSEEKLKNYLNMVGSMKPKQAAAVIQKLPEETVFMIFDQLRPNQVTKILENLPEAYLAKLTQDRLNKYRNI